MKSKTDSFMGFCFVKVFLKTAVELLVDFDIDSFHTFQLIVDSDLLISLLFLILFKINTVLLLSGHQLHFHMNSLSLYILHNKYRQVHLLFWQQNHIRSLNASIQRLRRFFVQKINKRTYVNSSLSDHYPRWFAISRRRNDHSWPFLA